MVKKLVAVGCSYTAADQSRGRVANHRFHRHRRVFPVWPELLAKKLNYKCINLGSGGAGNEYIFSRALDALVKEKDIGLMVVMWTEFHRMDWQRTDKVWSAIHYNVEGAERNKEKWKEDVVCLLNKNRFNNKKHQINRTLRFMYSLQKNCGIYDIPFIQLFGTDPCPQNEKYDAGKTILNSPFFDFIECLGWPIISSMGGWTVDTFLDQYEDVRISLDDCHPNAKGHKLISEKIYKHYENKYGTIF